MTFAIQTSALTKSYKTYEKPEGLMNSIRGFWNRKYLEKIALHPTDLKIEEGQIVGLVGANGAGKTTLLKILSGLIHPTQGEALVLGYRPWERKPEYLRQMSILLGQKNQLWWDLTPQDSYSLLTEIYDLPVQATKKRVLELAEVLSCQHVLQTQLRRLSLGERMKMEIIGALLHSPKVLFLDEPTIGLDIVAQSSIRKFLAEYVKQQKTTVILTSHYMDDIAKLADRLLLISKGSIVYDGTVDNFMTRAEANARRISFSLSEPLPLDFEINANHILQKGLQEYSFEATEPEIAPILAKITTLHGITDLKLNEADFEEIIHRFLEKESGVLSTSRH